MQKSVDVLGTINLEKLGKGVQQAYEDMHGIDISGLNAFINRTIAQNSSIDLRGLEKMLTDLLDSIDQNAELNELTSLVEETLRNMRFWNWMLRTIGYSPSFDNCFTMH